MVSDLTAFDALINLISRVNKLGLIKARHYLSFYVYINF